MELELQKEEVGQVGKRILNLLVTVPLTSRAVGYWSLAPELFTLLVDFVYLKRSQRSCRRCMEYIMDTGIKGFVSNQFPLRVLYSTASHPLRWDGISSTSALTGGCSDTVQHPEVHSSGG